MADRRAELAANLAEVRERIAAAARAAGRDPAALTLVAVTKTFPAADALLLAGLGCHDLGESREQELRAKATELATELAPELASAGADVTWHFLGRLQTNKARAVGALAGVVHSFDRAALAAPLARGAAEAGRPPVHVLLQVSLDGDPDRGGVLPADVPALADAAAQAGLVVAGVMAVAPLGAPPLPAFSRLAEISVLLRAGHPEAGQISAGMSGDLEDAVACGATHLRVGTALLGVRPPGTH